LEQMMSQTKNSFRRIPNKYTPYVFAFLMAGIMAFLMSMVIVAANSGIQTGYLFRVLHAYALAMPIAFICVLIVRPIVMYLVHQLVDPA
jgi:phosphotransferase system  glucose/maltose/N-acetylglucosamine-specific IIC component